ncbi:MAG: phage gp6-like head-tail connector protein [Sphingomonadaceae bacterium]|nr:phage gp6-like head-tail connector protein [Sphingomonadaceae bacterium]
MLQPGAAGRVEIACTAGMAQSWAELPEAIRLGVLRLAAHLHLHRDSPDDPGPPEAVRTLLRPWRRRRII